MARRIKLDILSQMLLDGLPRPESEYQFHPDRGWAFDFCWPAFLVSAEREGGTWIPGGGRHNRGAGFREDCDKYGEAAILGWLVIRFDASMEKSGRALDLIRRALVSRGWKPDERL